MGMTIDKAIEFFNGLECYTPQAKDARDVAIDTMQKYQKIQEIATTLEWEKEISYQSVIAMMNIRKVVEDGQNTIKD